MWDGAAIARFAGSDELIFLHGSREHQAHSRVKWEAQHWSDGVTRREFYVSRAVECTLAADEIPAIELCFCI